MPTLALMLALVTGQAVQKPDFSGHWIQESQPVPLTGRVPICGSDCTMLLTADRLIVTDGMHENSYKLDGAPAKAIATTPTVTAMITTVSKWDGTTIAIAETIESKNLNGGKPYTTMARISMSEAHLTIEGVRATKDGAQDKYHATYRLAK